MNTTLSKNQEVYLNGIKTRIATNLRGEFFDLRRTQIDFKDWRLFKKKVATEAISLLSEINRMKKDYTMVKVENLTIDTKGNDQQFFFDFYGVNGSVRFTFNKGINGVIHFDQVEETIYEEAFTLF